MTIIAPQKILVGTTFNSLLITVKSTILLCIENYWLKEQYFVVLTFKNVKFASSDN